MGDCFFKWAMFISSYIPLFVLIIINQLENLTILDLKKTYLLHSTFILILLFLSAISLIILWVFLKKSGDYSNSLYLKEIDTKDTEHIFTFKNSNSEVLNYFITYIFPLVTLDLGDEVDVLVNIIVFIIIGIYYTKNNDIHMNLILILLGYNVYECEQNNVILISDKNIDELKKYKKLNVNKVGNIYIDKKNDF